MNVDILKSIILGLVQGLTEFLPVSSSGHLVLAAEFLNFHDEGVAFEVFVHLGTLFSVLVVFRKKILQMIISPYEVWVNKSQDEDKIESSKWALYIIIGTLPAGLIGLAFKDQIEGIFSNFLLVLAMLLVTGTMMIISRYIANENKEMNIFKSILIGFAQAFAILPGISRSGSTIVTGMLLGIDRSRAAEFSFLLSIPVIVGATVLKISDLLESQISSNEIILLAVGTVSAFISGYFAIIWLLDIVKRGKLEWFGIYCYLIVIISSVWYFLK
jgi:undecaprenyl-diphosphatase